MHRRLYFSLALACLAGAIAVWVEAVREENAIPDAELIRLYPRLTSVQAMRTEDFNRGLAFFWIIPFAFVVAAVIFAIHGYRGDRK